jgi:hypothetical protein
MKLLILIALICPGISIAQTAADPCEQLGRPIMEEIRQIFYSNSTTPQTAKARELGARWATVVIECKIAIINAAERAAQAAALSKALASEGKK